MKNYFYITLFILLISNVHSQELSYPSYSIGNPSFLDLWVDPASGSDSNSGSSRTSAYKSLTKAWQAIPQGATLTQAYRINILPGSIPESNIPNYWEDRQGTSAYPIIIQAANGAGTVTLQGDINAYGIQYLYLLNISIVPDPAGDTFHCELCNHILLRGMTFNGGNRVAQETIKINQSQYIYIEDSDISGASDNAIDFVAVQYGHVVRNRIHNAEDWCMYVKGGSAQILVESNTIYSCGTGGFTAGQGTGFEFMTSPWLHYEAYDIKFVNNIIYNTEGAGFGVNGGYNILLAHNNLYKVGRRSHAMEVVYGYRSCDGNSAQCAANISAGGWGTSTTGTEGEPIPNKNVYIYNNALYNPVGFESTSSHFAIYGPRVPNAGTNLSNPVKTDVNLVIKGNVLWNGGGSLPLGIEDSGEGCQSSNTTCNMSQLASDNYLNTQAPHYIDPDNGDFRASTDSPLLSLSPADIPAFSGGDRQPTPLASEGVLLNSVNRDYSGTSRSGRSKIGAYAGSLRDLSAADGYLPWNSFIGMINILELTNRGSSNISVVATVYDISGQAISQSTVSLGSHAQQDVILNDLPGFKNNAYGLVAIDCASSDLDARVSVYKVSKSGQSFDFAYASPLLESTTGESFLSFNTMQPSPNSTDSSLLVYNWLSITNPDTVASHAFTIVRYDELGNELVRRRVTVEPFGRFDIEGGHEVPGKLRIGLNRIIPDDSTAPYFANIVRYGSDKGITRDFQFAYPIYARRGGDAIQYSPVSNGGNAQNWVEVVNASSSTTLVNLQVYDTNGNASGAASEVYIAPYSQYHFNASQKLDSGASGILKVTSSSSDSILINSLFYFFTPARSIAAMYGIKTLESSSGYASGSYNLFLGMGNFLKIANPTSVSRDITLRVYRSTSLLAENSYTIAPLATLELPMHEASRFNTESNTYGLLEVVGEGVSSHVLRIRPDGSSVNFIFPTQVR